MNTGPVIKAPCEGPFESRVIFVLGARRSGTTWLQELLLGHPDVVGVPAVEVSPGRLDAREPIIMRAIDDYWFNAHREDGDGLNAYLERDQVLTVLRRFCDRLFAEGRALYNPGAGWFVEKSPSNIRRLAMLAAIYPDAWYISIVRDGRDVARSLMGTPMAPSTAAQAAGEWVKSLDFLEQFRHLFGRFREVRYEAMLADPVAAAADLFEWLGLERNDGVLRAVEERSKREVARFDTKEPIGSGKWMRLSAHERATILDVAGDWLTELGYIDAVPAG